MRKLRVILRQRRGVTLVELVAAMAVMCLVMTMAGAALRPAAAVVRRIETLQEAQIVLDTVLEVLRAEIEGACGYVKLYESGADIENQWGTLEQGSALEFLNGEGCPVLISADGCGLTWLTEMKTEAEEISPGRLFFLTREAPAADGTYPARDGDWGLAQRRWEPFGEGFYVGLYLALEFAPGKEALEDAPAETLLVTAALYRDAERTELVTKESLLVDLRNIPHWTMAVTAINE